MSSDITQLQKTLKEARLVSILYGVSYQGNAGSCYRTANVVGETVPTIMVPPTQEQLEQESFKQVQQGYAKLKQYHTNKYMNHFILMVIYLINLLINTGDKLRSYFPSPYDGQGQYYRRFIRETRYYSSIKVNDDHRDAVSTLFFNIPWDQLVEVLVKEGYQICLIENDDRFPKENLYKYQIDSTMKYALVVGSEIAGLPNRAFQSSKQLFIPTHYSKSLNVSIAHGIALTYFNFKQNEILQKNETFLN